MLFLLSSCQMVDKGADRHCGTSAVSASRKPEGADVPWLGI